MQAPDDTSSRTEMQVRLLPAPASMTSGRNQVTGLPLRHSVQPLAEPHIMYLYRRRSLSKPADPQRRGKSHLGGKAGTRGHPFE